MIAARAPTVRAWRGFTAATLGAGGQAGASAAFGYFWRFVRTPHGTSRGECQRLTSGEPFAGNSHIAPLLLDNRCPVPYLARWHSGGASAMQIAPQTQIFDMEDR